MGWHCPRQTLVCNLGVLDSLLLPEEQVAGVPFCNCELCITYPFLDQQSLLAITDTLVTSILIIATRSIRAALENQPEAPIGSKCNGSHGFIQTQRYICVTSPAGAALADSLLPGPVQGPGCPFQSPTWFGTKLFEGPYFPNYMYPIHHSREAEYVTSLLS